MTEIELTPVEFAALLERLGVMYDAAGSARLRTIASGGSVAFSDRYVLTLHPATFWVKAEAWERHKVQALLAKLSSGWKDTLTEPTLQKLRALLAEPKVETPDKETE